MKSLGTLQPNEVEKARSRRQPINDALVLAVHSIGLVDQVDLLLYMYACHGKYQLDGQKSMSCFRKNNSAVPEAVI